MSILKTLLVLLLVFFPFGEIIRFDLGNNIILKPIDVISGLILIWTIVLYSKERQFRSSLHWYFFLFPLIGLLSLGINSFWLKPTEILTSFLYLLRWISYMSIFFATIQLDQYFRKKIAWLLFADGFIVLLIGLLQFFFYPNLRNLYYQGWDDHLYRLFSSFFDPNFVGAFYVLFLLFVTGFLFSKTKKNIRNLIIQTIIIVVTLIATFLTYSRSALIMLITSGVTFFLLAQKKKFIIYLLIIIGLFVAIASPFFNTEDFNLFRIRSSIARIRVLEKGIIIFKDHPIIGVGFNSFRYAQYRYHFESPKNPNPVHDASGTDNSYIFILDTTGIVGFGAYCYLWFNLFKKARETKNRYSPIFIASAIGLFVNSLFNNSLFYSEIMLWMWFIASFIY